jgi:hypothetical protein
MVDSHYKFYFAKNYVSFPKTCSILLPNKAEKVQECDATMLIINHQLGTQYFKT